MRNDYGSRCPFLRREGGDGKEMVKLGEGMKEQRTGTERGGFGPSSVPVPTHLFHWIKSLLEKEAPFESWTEGAKQKAKTVINATFGKLT